MRNIILVVVILYAALSEISAQTTLPEYRSAVVDYSTELQQSKFAAEGAEADMQLARKGYLPRLDMSREGRQAFGGVDVGRSWSWAMRADISQPLFEGGGVRARAKASVARFMIAENRVDKATLDAIYVADVAYWKLSQMAVYVQAMEEYVAIVGSLRDVVKRRLEEGYTAKGDLLQVESRLSDAEYQLVSAQQSYMIALHEFNSLRGADVKEDVVLAQSIFTVADMPERVEVDLILARHPDYVVSRLAEDAARWDVRAVVANYLPQISAGIYGVWQSAIPNIKGAGTSLNGGIVITMTTPIFHFGERRQALASARAALNSSSAVSQQVRDRVLLDESNGWVNLLNSQRRVASAERSLDIANENLQMSTYSYREGVATLLDLLQAQLSWLQIYRNVIAAYYDYAVAVAGYAYVTAQM